MTRTKFIAGNWKMFTSSATGRALAAEIVAGSENTSVRVAVCPPFPYLAVVAAELKGSPIALGGQNVYPADEGAFTGEVSPVMLRDVGCQYVIVGHSERRHGLGEQDDFINRKVRAAINAGLDVILCVGETQDERDSNRTTDVLIRQLANGLKGIAAESMEHLVVAYEPVWAIGTGKVATTAQAQEAHSMIRRQIETMYDQGVADKLIIQYGGSAKPENVRELLQQPDVDGALVGGASLKAELFLKIIALAG